MVLYYSPILINGSKLRKYGSPDEDVKKKEKKKEKKKKEKKNLGKQ